MHGIVWRNLLAPMTVLASLMILLIASSVLVVNRAQRLLDRHARLLIELRQKLERFVSRSAVEAARFEARAGVTVARRVRCTLLFADVRSFTTTLTNFSATAPWSDSKDRIASSGR
jgi:adenylate cyclase